MNELRYILIVTLLAFAPLAGCGSSSNNVETCSVCPNIDAGGIAQEGGSCTTAKDCACKFDCIANVCVAYKGAFAGCQCATDACDPATDEGTTDEGTTDEDAGTSTGEEDTNDPEDTNGTGGDGQPEVVILPPDIGGTSSGSTGDDVETTPPTTCKEALPCQLACKDSDCSDDCVADADTAVTDPYSAMVSCLSTECGGPTNKSEKYECLLDLCFDSFHGCYLNGVIGEESCDNTEKCSGACADADCQYECVKSAKKIAQQNYLKLHICIQEFCENNPLLSEEDCTKTGQGVCGLHYNHCIQGS